MIAILMDIQDSLDVFMKCLLHLSSNSRSLRVPLLIYSRSIYISKWPLVWQRHVSLLSCNSHTHLPVGIHTVEGIAVDWMGQNLYWTDDGPEKTISVAKLEKASQTRKTLLEGKMTHPRAIVVDPAHG